MSIFIESQILRVSARVILGLTLRNGCVSGLLLR